ncbi:ABC transporter substrate-binding protein [Nocardia inohanensis]|uniref:ABC transporter substrate-binding protein n=1 Tax=Nocardia inohanensis TaxID=209246 RepID=UPI0008322487|nr:ABC transporter substrate-binding protein [Nocardia inohanensis]
MRRRGKYFVSAVVAATVSMLLTACGGGDLKESGGVPVLRYQGWASQVTIPELAEDLGFFDGKVKLDWQGNTISGPQDIQSAATGQVDFGGAFGGAVAKLAQAGAPITAVINYYGSDEKTFTGFYVPEDSPIRTPKDLVGKKIGVNTLGGQSEADVHTALKKNGLDEQQIKQVQLVVLPPPNTEDAVRRGQVDVAALSGQFQQRALANGGLRPVFTDFEQFGPFNGGQYIFRNDFLAKNAAVVEAFVNGVAKAIEWQKTTPRDQVVAKFTEIIEKRKRAGEDASSVKFWQSVGVPAKNGVITDADFQRWEPWLRDTGAITGTLDVSKLYTNKYNPNSPQ